MKLERGYLHAKKIGDADAFGFYERTPSLPLAAKENPGSSFIPSSMDGACELDCRVAGMNKRGRCGGSNSWVRPRRWEPRSLDGDAIPANVAGERHAAARFRLPP